MSTSTLVPQEETWFRSGRPWSDHRIRQFVTVSVAVHLGVLFLLRVPGSADSISVFPDLFVTVELDDGRDPESERPPPAQPAEESTPSSDELVATEGEAPQAVDVPALPSANELSPAPTEDGSARDEAPSESPAVPEPGNLLAGPAIVTTTGDSDFVAPANAEQTPALSESEYLPIPSTQQGKLTRRLMQGAQALQKSDEPQVRLSWEEGDRTYVATLTRQPATDGMGIERATIDIETAEHGKRLRTRVNMKRLAFSHFTQLVDRWDPEVQLHDDVISGRFHSNSEILLGYDRKVAPLFLGKVTTAARSFAVANTLGRRRRDEIFPQGLETRVDRIRFPDKLLGPLDPDAAEVHAVTGDAHIRFFSEGSYGLVEPGLTKRVDRQLHPTKPTYILGATHRTLYISGIVRGKVLVYSPERIVIEDDLVYARDPHANPGSDDYIGIVSDRDVEVATPRFTGPGDLRIQGAVYARRRFEVTSIESRRAGTLFIFGSLTAGSISATEPRYATTIEFDPRFERLRPPGFPQTNAYEIETWDQRWQAVEND